MDLDTDLRCRTWQHTWGGRTDPERSPDHTETRETESPPGEAETEKYFRINNNVYHSYMVSESLLVDEVCWYVRDHDPEAVSQHSQHSIWHQSEWERRRCSLMTVLELLTGDQRTHDTQGQVETERWQHQEARDQRLLPLHPAPDPDQSGMSIIMNQPIRDEYYLSRQKLTHLALTQARMTEVR